MCKILTMKQILIILTFITLFSCNNNKKTDITILGESATSIQSMIALENEYESKNLNIDLIFKPNSFDDAFNKANQDFSNGTGLYDIVMQYNFSLASFVNNDYVYDIDKLTSNFPKKLLVFEKDLFENAWKEVGFYKSKENDKIIKVGYPFTANTMFIAYNQTLFNDDTQKKEYQKIYGKELKAPESWEDFYKISEFFTQKDKGLYGICLQGANGGWLYYEWMNFLFGMGGKTMNKQYGWEGDINTKTELNSQESIKAAKYYMSLKPYNAGTFTNIDAYQQIEILKEGKVAMSIIWSDLAYNLVSKADGSFDDRFAFIPIPGGKSMLAGGSYFINKNSSNPLESAKYIIDLMSKENQIKMAKTGLCSALKTVYQDPEIKKIPYSLALEESLNNGVYMLEAGVDATLISDKITYYLQKIWNEEYSVEEGLDRMQADIEKERKKLYNNLNNK